MQFDHLFPTTLIGSVHHTDASQICQQIVASVDIPCWPQLPRRNFREGIYVQYAASLPGMVLDEINERITLDTTADLTSELEKFYEHYLADDLNYFGLPVEFAAGFHAVLPVLEKTVGEWVKGHVVGPLTFGLTVVDQDLRAVFYHEMLADVIIKNMALNARWQVRELKKYRSNVILFVDEPYLGSWGTAYVSIDRAQSIAALDEIFEANHAEGGLAGVHCCANTDWSILLSTSVDILNLDAYGFLENLALYPSELRAFLDRGGQIAWGIIPNDETIFSVTSQQLAGQLLAGFGLISQKAAARHVVIDPQEFETRSLLTPACGLGSTQPEVVNRVLKVLTETSRILQNF